MSRLERALEVGYLGVKVCPRHLPAPARLGVGGRCWPRVSALRVAHKGLAGEPFYLALSSLAKSSDSESIVGTPLLQISRVRKICTILGAFAWKLYITFAQPNGGILTEPRHNSTPVVTVQFAAQKSLQVRSGRPKFWASKRTSPKFNDHGSFRYLCPFCLSNARLLVSAS